MLERKKGLTENELRRLRDQFKRRQNKFTAITGQTQVRISAGTMPQISAASTTDAHDDDETFEKVDVEINPIIAERNEELFSMKEYSSLANVNETLAQKSLLTKKCGSQSTAASSRLNTISKSKISLSQMPSEIIPTTVVERRESSRKDPGTISSSSESKTDEIKNIKSGPKMIKSKVKQDMDERKKLKDKGKKEKEKEKEKSVGRRNLETRQKRMKVSLKNHKKKEDIEDVEKRKRTRDEAKKSEEKKLKDRGVLHINAEEKKLVLESEENRKLVEASGKYELESKTSKYDPDKSLAETASSQANIPWKQFSQSMSDINLLLKPIEMAKKDQLLYEKMDDDIVLDTNVLQSLATDLTTESNNVVVSEIARKIVEALTSNQVLGKVLTPEEAIILKDYFSQKIPLSEKVLATLDTALDKILRHVHEFYDDKQELNAFLKDRDSAKAKLLDALIAKKSNYLADLMTDASYYAEQISKGLIDVYKLATEGILVARENFQYMQAVVGHTYRYSKDMAYRGAALTYETAARSRELAEIGASVGAQMTYDAAKMTLDTAIRGKELAERGAAIGTKMTSDAAKMTYDVSNRGKELAELGVAISAKMTQDAASKGLQIAEETIHAASKGKELVKDSLTAATNATLDFSETALEGAMQVTELIGKKVQDVTSAMNQARSEIQDDEDDSDDDSDKKRTSLSPKEKSTMENQQQKN